jgi:hypothetical protein
VSCEPKQYRGGCEGVCSLYRRVLSNYHGNREALNDEDLMVSKVLLEGNRRTSTCLQHQHWQRRTSSKSSPLWPSVRKAIQKRVEEKPALQKGKRHHRLQPVLVDFNT